MGLHSLSLIGEYGPRVEGSSALDEWDVAPLSRQDRYHRAFARLPFELRVIVEKRQIGAYHERYNGLNQDGLVTFVAVCNFGGNLIPLTPWIILHRMHHSAMTRIGTEAVDDLAEIFTDLFSAGYERALTPQSFFLPKYQTKGQPYKVRGGIDLTINEISNKESADIFASILTMRSARTTGFVTDIDIAAEMFAQYGITGGVRLRHAPDMAPIDLQPYEERINSVMAQMCRDMVGKSFVF